ncbi:hypothetical protein, partial [Micromonospora sp. NPDC003241]
MLGRNVCKEIMAVPGGFVLTGARTQESHLTALANWIASPSLVEGTLIHLIEETPQSAVGLDYLHGQPFADGLILAPSTVRRSRPLPDHAEALGDLADRYRMQLQVPVGEARSEQPDRLVPVDPRGRETSWEDAAWVRVLPQSQVAGRLALRAAYERVVRGDAPGRLRVAGLLGDLPEDGRALIPPGTLAAAVYLARFGTETEATGLVRKLLPVAVADLPALVGGIRQPVDADALVDALRGASGSAALVLFDAQAGAPTAAWLMSEGGHLWWIGAAPGKNGPRIVTVLADDWQMAALRKGSTTVLLVDRDGRPTAVDTLRDRDPGQAVPAPAPAVGQPSGDTNRAIPAQTSFTGHISVQQTVQGKKERLRIPVLVDEQGVHSVHPETGEPTGADYRLTNGQWMPRLRGGTGHAGPPSRDARLPADPDAALGMSTQDPSSASQATLTLADTGPVVDFASRIEDAAVERLGARDLVALLVDDGEVVVLGEITTAGFTSALELPTSGGYTVKLGQLPDGNLLLAIAETYDSTKPGAVRLLEIAETPDGPTARPVGEPILRDDGRITAMTFGQLPGGNLALAIAFGRGTELNDELVDQHGTVRLWEITETAGGPMAQPVVGPLISVNQVVVAMALRQVPGGSILLATGHPSAPTRLWEITETANGSTAQPVGDLLTDHTPMTTEMAFWQLPGGALHLATINVELPTSHSDDQTLVVWEIARTSAGTRFRQVFNGPRDNVDTVREVAFSEIDGRPRLLVVHQRGDVHQLAVQEVLAGYAERPDSLMESLVWLLDQEAYPGLFAGWTAANLRTAMQALNNHNDLESHRGLVEVFAARFGVQVQTQSGRSGSAKYGAVFGAVGPLLVLQEDDASPGRFSPVRSRFGLTPSSPAPAVVLRGLESRWQAAVDGAIAGSRTRHDERLATDPAEFSGYPLFDRLRERYESAVRFVDLLRNARTFVGMEPPVPAGAVAWLGTLMQAVRQAATALDDYLQDPVAVTAEQIDQFTPPAISGMQSGNHDQLRMWRQVYGPVERVVTEFGTPAHPGPLAQRLQNLAADLSPSEARLAEAVTSLGWRLAEWGGWATVRGRLLAYWAQQPDAVALTRAMHILYSALNDDLRTRLSSLATRQVWGSPTPPPAAVERFLRALVLADYSLHVGGAEESPTEAVSVVMDSPQGPMPTLDWERINQQFENPDGSAVDPNQLVTEPETWWTRHNRVEPLLDLSTHPSNEVEQFRRALTPSPSSLRLHRPEPGLALVPTFDTNGDGAEQYQAIIEAVATLAGAARHFTDYPQDSWQIETDAGLALASGPTVDLPNWALRPTGPLNQVLTDRDGPPILRAAAWQLDERDLIASAGPDHRLRLWEVTAAGVNELRALLPMIYTENVLAVEFGQLRNGTLLLAAGNAYDTAVRLWKITDTPNGTSAQSAGRVLNETGPVTAMDFGQLPNGDLVLAIGDAVGAVQLWEITETTTGPTGRRLGDRLISGNNTVTAVTVGQLPGGDLILAAGNQAGGEVRVWRITTAQVTEIGDPLTTVGVGIVAAVDFGKLPGGGLLLAVGYTDQTADRLHDTLRLWEFTETETGLRVRQVDNASHVPYDVAALSFSEVDRQLRLLAVTDDGRTARWDITDASEAGMSGMNAAITPEIEPIDGEPVPDGFTLSGVGTDLSTVVGAQQAA